MNACPAPARRQVAIENQTDLARKVAQKVEHPGLSTMVEFAIVDDEQLTHLCDAAATSAAARHHRVEAVGSQGARVDEANDMWRTAVSIAHDRALEVVAEECLAVLGDGSTGRETAETREAARRWLQVHLDVVERAGLSDEVGEHGGVPA